MIYPNDPSRFARPPRRSRPVRRTVATVLAVGVLIALLADPRGFAAIATLILVVGAVLGLLVVRGAWRTLRRPIGSLSVGDAVLGGLALRWWRQRQDRRHEYLMSRHDDRLFTPPTDPRSHRWDPPSRSWP